MDFCLDCQGVENGITSGIIGYSILFIVLWVVWLRKMPANRRLYATLLLVFLALTLDLTLFPISFVPDNAISGNMNLEWFRFVREIMDYQSSAVLKFTILNVLLFVPIGYFVKRTFPKTKWYMLVLGCILISVGIESIQAIGSYLHISYRIFDVDDIVMNTLGAIIGMCASHLFHISHLRGAGKLQDLIYKNHRMIEIVGFLLMILLCYIGIHLIY